MAAAHCLRVWTYLRHRAAEGTGCIVQAGSQYRRYAEPAGQMQDGKWVSASNKAGLTLRFENSGGKPPGPYCRDLEEAPAEGEVRPLRPL